MNGPPPDIYLEVQKGWRTWRLDQSYDKVRLVSPDLGSVWVPGKRFEAHCPHQGGERSTCYCGVNCYKSLRHLKAARHNILSVWGEIALWGEVQELEKGYRGQYAYPTKLLVNKETPAYLVKALEEDYGVCVELKDSDLIQPLASQDPINPMFIPRSRLSIWSIITWGVLLSGFCIYVFILNAPKADSYKEPTLSANEKKENYMGYWKAQHRQLALRSYIDGPFTLKVEGWVNVDDGTYYLDEKANINQHTSCLPYESENNTSCHAKSLKKEDLKWITQSMALKAPGQCTQVVWDMDHELNSAFKSEKEKTWKDLRKLGENLFAKACLQADNSIRVNPIKPH